MSEFVTCYTMHGEAIPVRTSDLTFRPSAYAIIVHEGKLLLTNTRSTGKWSAPGGGVEIGETLEAALRRELKEECGIEIEIVARAFFHETFLYYPPLKRAWQCHQFFFVCKPLSLELSDALNVEDDEAESPQWVDVPTLRAERIQLCGKEIMEFLGTKNGP